MRGPIGRLSKVNRSLTEGRRAPRQKATAIEGGDECERLAPLLSRLADGACGVDDRTGLHLRTCLSCRTRLRALRAATREPARDGLREAA